MSVTETITQFKSDLRQSNIDYEQVVRKYLIDAPTYFFHEKIKKPDAENNLKQLVAGAFSINQKDIFIVGSGKLGFSIAPNKLFDKFDFAYTKTKKHRDRSDLDIAIVSSKLFESIGKRMYNYTAAYRRPWFSNEYYPADIPHGYDVDIYYKHFEYYTKGWFRPDFKPPGFDFCNNGSLQELKRDMTNIIDRSGSIAIYKSWFYFADYHVNNIKNLSLKAKSEKI